MCIISPQSSNSQPPLYLLSFQPLWLPPPANSSQFCITPTMVCLAPICQAPDQGLLCNDYSWRGIPGTFTPPVMLTHARSKKCSFHQSTQGESIPTHVIPPQNNTE